MKLKPPRLVFLLFLILIFSGCSKADQKETITDRAGTTISGKWEKIISTAPSNTEILIGLGLADKLIAADRYSADLEGIAKNILLIDFAYPDAEAIIGLDPDIIIAA
jgi:iron complex transport system substrate-binding protein